MLVPNSITFNTFLIESISNQTNIEIVIPSEEIVNFKEALIFAFLGVLKYRGEINCFASVTGATQDHSSGIVFLC